MKYVSILITGVMLTACEQGKTGQTSAEMANPASEYCISIGGRLEIRDGPDGQAGYCHLPDGRVVDEWTLFREQEQ